MHAAGMLLCSEAVAYIGGSSEWSVSRRLICLGDLPEGLRTAQSALRSKAERRRRTYATASSRSDTRSSQRQVGAGVRGRLQTAWKARVIWRMLGVSGGGTTRE
jgi:hypothetical protein